MHRFCFDEAGTRPLSGDQMDKSRPSFKLQRDGDEQRLLWRYPCADRRVAAQLAPVLDALGQAAPGQISIGRFARLDDGAVAFVPATTPLARAALGIEMVQRRLCADLAAMAGEK